jgi:exopolysaccharide biosynthesis polyprenyl glycosylphosphotransferase
VTLERLSKAGAPLLAVLDLVLITGGFLLCLFLRDHLGPPPHPASARIATYLTILLGAGPLLLVSFGWAGMYRIDRAANGLRAWTRAASAVTTVALLGVLLLFLAPGYRSGFIYSRLLLLLYYAFLVLSVGCSRAVVRAACRRLWTQRRLLRRVLLVGEAEAAQRIAGQLLAEPGCGYEPAGTLELPATESDEGARALMQAWEELTDRERPGGAIFVADHRSFRAYSSLVLHCLEHDLEVKVIARPDLLPYIQRDAGEICGHPAVDLTRTSLHWLKRGLKRLADLLLAAAGLVLTTPLLIALGAVVRVHDGGPALFLQRRAGRRGRPFTLIKLRTMHVDASVDAAANIAEGPLTRIPDDPRVTSVGAWLRRHKLDELPQLLNVLLGQMSLVGPRPPTEEEVAQYELWQRGRLFIRPGLTGLWQIDKQRKWRFNEMVELDLQYILNWSLLLDCSIILRTIPVVLRGS